MMRQFTVRGMKTLASALAFDPLLPRRETRPRSREAISPPADEKQTLADDHHCSLLSQNSFAIAAVNFRQPHFDVSEVMTFVSRNNTHDYSVFLLPSMKFCRQILIAEMRLEIGINRPQSTNMAILIGPKTLQI